MNVTGVRPCFLFVNVPRWTRGGSTLHRGRPAPDCWVDEQTGYGSVCHLRRRRVIAPSTPSPRSAIVEGSGM